MLLLMIMLMMLRVDGGAQHGRVFRGRAAAGRSSRRRHRRRRRLSVEEVVQPARMLRQFVAGHLEAVVVHEVLHRTNINHG